MRKVVYIAILSLLFFAPLERVDVSKLLPIRAVAVYTQGEEVVLETDTEHKGTGRDALQALKNLKEETPAVVYLDTAEYLLVSQEAEIYIPQLSDWLKPSVKVSICDVREQVKEAAEYLDVHGGVTELRHWRTK